MGGAARLVLLSLALLLLLAANGEAALVIGPPSVSATVNQAFQWAVQKTATPSEVTVPADGSATINYRVSVTKSLTSQQVTVTGSFSLTGTDPTDAFAQPSVTVSGSPTPVAATCSPGGALPSQCSFTASWANSDVTAASTGTVTVSAPGAAPVQAPYTFTGGGSQSVTGDCATLTDAVTGGTVTDSQITWSGGRPPTTGGVPVCESGTKVYEYTGTFSGAGSSLTCGQDLVLSNTATLTPSGGAPLADSATVRVRPPGCSGVTASIGNLKTTVIQTYTWSLEKTGGGSGLTTTPDKELSVAFTITATRTPTATVGYVAGSVTVQNSGDASVSISGISLSVAGQPPQNVVVSNCATPTLATKGASTSCTFNVSNAAAPAAGTVTATVTYASAGGASATVDAAPQEFSYNTAETYTLGGTANLYDVVDTRGLSSLGSVTTLAGTTVANTASMVRFEPAAERPPGTEPGLSLSDSRVFSYSMIIQRLGICSTNRVVSNTATLTPVGSTQGSLTRSAQVSFSVEGCNVLPTISLANTQTWSAVTYSWAMTKAAIPSSYQLAPGQAGTATYELRFTRTQSSGNYWLSGQLQLTNPATFPMYISSVGLVSSSGQIGAIPTACLGGSTIGGSTISGADGFNTVPGTIGGVGGLGSTTTGSFLLAVGAQVQCNFNVTAGTGAPPTGNVYAQATTTSSFVSAGGNVALSSQVPINFQAPTKQWDIAGCVRLSDTATSTGSAGAWQPQLTGLPANQEICETRTFTYAAQISAPPMLGTTCNVPVTITNNAQAMPQGAGAAVSASAQIQVMAISCASNSLSPSPVPVAAPSPSPAIADGLGLQSNLPLTVSIMPGVDVDVSGSAGSSRSQWSLDVSNNAQDNGVSMPYSATRQVQFTVTAKRGAASGRVFVSGTITVANPNAAAATLSAVTAEFPIGSVPAVCPRRLPASLPAGSSIVCGYNASLPASDPGGSITATATSAAGVAASRGAVSYSIAAALGGSSAGGGDDVDDAGPQDTGCAVIEDAILPLPVLTASSLRLNSSRPRGNAVPVCKDTTYSYTATFGPFPDSACNLYTVTAVSTLTPDGGTPVTARDELPLQIESCPNRMASVSNSRLAGGAVAVELAPPTATSTSKYTWSATAAAEPFRYSVPYREPVTLKWRLTWDKAAAASTELSGTITITNPSAAPVAIRAASIQPELTGSTAALGAGAAPAVAARCPGSEVPPGGRLSCTYRATLAQAGAGKVTAEVTLGSGQTLDAQASFAPASSVAAAPGADSCAELVTGLFMSTAQLLPGQPPTPKALVERACAGGSKELTLRLGPFGGSDCGNHKVMATARVRPLIGATRRPPQPAFAALAPASLTITGCPLEVTPSPVPSVDETLAVTTSVAYRWSLSATANNSDPLVLADPAAPVVVGVRASATRDSGARSAGVVGTVRVRAQGRAELTVHRVQVASQSRLGDLVLVDAACPAASKAGELLRVPALPGALECSFALAGLPPMDGAVMPVVTLTPGNTSPLPADAIIFRTAGAKATVTGECARIGSSRALTRNGAPMPGQPARAGAGFPSAPVCSSTSAEFAWVFGPFGRDQCGLYQFSGDVVANLDGSPAVERREFRFGVQVQGC